MELQVQIYVESTSDSSKEAELDSFRYIQSHIQCNSTIITIEDNTNDKLYNIQDMIELLGSYLTSNNNNYRNKATRLLAELFNTIDFIFTSPVLHLLIIFFCHRLSDYPSIVPSLNSLIIIINKYNKDLDSKYNDAYDILHTIFNNMHVPSHAQNIRQKAFELCSIILSVDTIIDNLYSYGDEILSGLSTVMEEEKDPRCLLLAFQNIYSAMQVFPHSLGTMPGKNDNEYGNSQISETIMKVFEATSCYFPITFSPPPDDPFGITPESLISSLEDCLCGNASIASALTVPFYIEQLNQDLAIARTHALQGLIRLARSYSHCIVYYYRRSKSNNSDIGDSSIAKRARTNYQEDMADMYIQDDNDMTIDEDLETEVPKYMYLQQLSNFLYEMATEETSVDFIAHALTLIGEISHSISRDINGKYVKDWKCFTESILTKIRNEISSAKNCGELGSLRMKSNINIALVIARLGGYMCAGAVVNYLFDPLLGFMQQSRVQLQDKVIRSISAYVYRGIPRLNVLEESLTSRGGNSITNASNTMGIPIEILSQILLVYSKYQSNDESSAVAGTEFAGLNLSRMGHLNPLLSHATRIYDNIITFFESLLPKILESSEATSNLSDGTDTVNPFLKVKEEHSVAQSGASDNGAFAQNISYTEVFFEPGIFSCLSLVVTLTKDFLMSVETDRLEQDSISYLLGRICDIAVHGLSALWDSDQNSSDNINVTMKILKYCSENEKHSTNIKTSATRCLVELMHCGRFDTVLQSECIDRLLTKAEEPGTSAAGDTLQVYIVLAALVRQTDNSETLLSLLLLFHKTLHCVFMNDNSEVNSIDKIRQDLLKVRCVWIAMNSMIQAVLPEENNNNNNVEILDVKNNVTKCVVFVSSHSSISDGKSLLYSMMVNTMRSLEIIINDEVTYDDSSVVTDIIGAFYSCIRHVVAGLLNHHDNESTGSDCLVLQTAFVSELLYTLQNVITNGSFINNNNENHDFVNTVAIGVAINSLLYCSKTSSLLSDNEQLFSYWVNLAIDCTKSDASHQSKWGYYWSLAKFNRIILGEFSSPQLLGILINKVQPGKGLNSLLSCIVSFCIKDHQSITSVKLVAQMLLWCAKAIFMRPNVEFDYSTVDNIDNQLAEVVKKTINSVDKDRVTWQDVFRTLLMDSFTKSNTNNERNMSFSCYVAAECSILTIDHQLFLPAPINNSSPELLKLVNKCTCNRALFWKQKLWSQLSSTLFANALIGAKQINAMTNKVAEYSKLEEQNSDSRVIMLALCTLVQGVPLSTLSADLLNDLTQVIIFIAAQAQTSNQLSSELNTCLTKAGFVTMEMLLHYDVTKFVPYLNVVIPALLKIIRESKTGRMRASGVECLAAITEHVPYSRLFPFKGAVEKGLKNTLDDKKRAVRVLASKLRNKWMLIK